MGPPFEIFQFVNFDFAVTRDDLTCARKCPACGNLFCDGTEEGRAAVCLDGRGKGGVGEYDEIPLKAPCLRG
jgi:hypothetical protein